MCIRDSTNAAYIEFDPFTNTDDGSCATPIVLGCTNAAYTEFDPFANTDDGSCATVLGCTASNNALYNPQANTDDGSCSATCVDVVMDGYTYDVVLIGSQCWFAENLRTTVYADGSGIPEITDDFDWIYWHPWLHPTFWGRRCNYDNNGGNVATYGRLYNFYAVNDARALCPAGWHVPTDSDWMEFEMEYGMSASDANSLDWRYVPDYYTGVDFGTAWSGWRNSYDTQAPNDGGFYAAGINEIWWSSSSFTDVDGLWYGYGRGQSTYAPMYVQRQYFSPWYGFSVRCLKDTE